MRKLVRPDSPKVLTDNFVSWTQELLDQVAVHGGKYSLVPKDTKSKLESKYRADDIRTVLHAMSGGKCCYCERKVQIGSEFQVEHFNPKVHYPDEMYLWENLLPSCDTCNQHKLDHDTKLQPLVNPVIDNPEEYFKLSYVELEPREGLSGPDANKARRTRDAVNLNRETITSRRVEILPRLLGLRFQIRKVLETLADSSITYQKRTAILDAISETLDSLDAMCHPSSNYSLISLLFVRSTPEFATAAQELASVRGRTYTFIK